MDFLVTDVVQENRWSPLTPLQFGDKVVQALRHVFRDRTIT